VDFILKVENSTSLVLKIRGHLSFGLELVQASLLLWQVWLI